MAALHHQSHVTMTKSTAEPDLEIFHLIFILHIIMKLFLTEISVEITFSVSLVVAPILWFNWFIIHYKKSRTVLREDLRSSTLKQGDRIRSILFHVIYFNAIKINFGGKTKPSESYSKWPVLLCRYSFVPHDRHEICFQNISTKLWFSIMCSVGQYPLGYKVKC